MTIRNNTTKFKARRNDEDHDNYYRWWSVIGDSAGDNSIQAASLFLL